MSRPELDAGMSEGELRRWYWLREELAAFARTLGVSASGSKVQLTERIAARLAGRAAEAAPQRRTSGAQLTGVLGVDTVIPPGQRSSQALREFFEHQIGPSFHFDAEMRDFIANGSGRTLGDAVEHWHTSRTTEAKPIDGQFELNRFTRVWHLDHPDGTRAELLEAWRLYRATPTDERPMA